MLSADCEGCGQRRQCEERYKRTEWGDKVYCPDGTAHLIDEAVVS